MNEFIFPASLSVNRRKFLRRLGISSAIFAINPSVLAADLSDSDENSEASRYAHELENKFGIVFPAKDEIDKINSDNQGIYKNLPSPEELDPDRLALLSDIFTILPPRFYRPDSYGKLNIIFSTIKDAECNCTGFLDKRQDAQFMMLTDLRFNPSSPNSRRTASLLVAHEGGHRVDPNVLPGNIRTANKEVDAIFDGNFSDNRLKIWQYMKESYDPWAINSNGPDADILDYMYDRLDYVLTQNTDINKPATPEELVAVYCEFRFIGEDVTKNMAKRLLPDEIASGMHNYIEENYFI